MGEATWVNGKKRVSGRWSYYRPSDVFVIELDQRDRITGSRSKIFTTHNDTPEWGNWKILKKPPMTPTNTAALRALAQKDQDNGWF